MAQKSKLAAKKARSVVSSGKKSKVKQVPKLEKSKGSNGLVTKAGGKPSEISVNIASKVVKVTSSVKTQDLGREKTQDNVDSVATPEGKQIRRAKAALKKQSGAAASTRSESKPRARKISIEVSANEAASALAEKWSALHKKAEQIESRPYNMKFQYEERTAIHHKVMGWGYILANRNDRLEVLFKDGIKYLISNYKS